MLTPRPTLRPDPRQERQLHDLGALSAREARLIPTPEGLRVLELTGSLPEDWCVRLSRGLAARNVSLVRGRARRAGASAWAAELHLEGIEGAEPPDLLELATRGNAPPWAATPALLDLELTPEGGTLHVEVEAWDAVGLLAAVLERIAAVELRCEVLEFETVDGLAFQALSLRGSRGAPVSEEARARLAGELGRLTV